MKLIEPFERSSTSRVREGISSEYYDSDIRLEIEWSSVGGLTYLHSSRPLDSMYVCVTHSVHLTSDKANWEPPPPKKERSFRKKKTRAKPFSFLPAEPFSSLVRSTLHCSPKQSIAGSTARGKSHRLYHYQVQFQLRL